MRIFWSFLGCLYHFFLVEAQSISVELEFPIRVSESGMEPPSISLPPPEAVIPSVRQWMVYVKQHNCRLGPVLTSTPNCAKKGVKKGARHSIRVMSISCNVHHCWRYQRCFKESAVFWSLSIHMTGTYEKDKLYCT